MLGLARVVPLHWRESLKIAGLSGLLFVVLPLIVRALGGTFADGVLIGTGVAIVWYTLETRALRSETANLTREAMVQTKVAQDQIQIALQQRDAVKEQIQIALQQRDAAITPLLVTRLEDVPIPGTTLHLPQPFHRCFVLRNIGHGPALFVQIETFTVDIATIGPCGVRVFPVDLVEPGGIAIPQVDFYLIGRQGKLPSYSEFFEGLEPPPRESAQGRCRITIAYQDVQKRRLQSVMEMGLGGTQLLQYSTV